MKSSRITWGIAAAALAVAQPFITARSHADDTRTAPVCEALSPNMHAPDYQEVQFFQMDVPAAIAACEAALAGQPGDARLQYRYGVALWKARRHREAMDSMRKAADQDYVPAQADLAYFYRQMPEASGYGSKEEASAEAFRLARLAADQGDIIAIGDVGTCYEYGNGVERNYDEALRWLRRAVERDQRYAESHLGEMYKMGWGVPQDDREAVKWFRRSADQGYRGGLYNLALMLLAGRGVERDVTAAEELLLRAAAMEHDGARRQLERLRSGRQDLR
jgi:TPR repeat protein